MPDDSSEYEDYFSFEEKRLKFLKKQTTSQASIASNQNPQLILGQGQKPEAIQTPTGEATASNLTKKGKSGTQSPISPQIQPPSRQSRTNAVLPKDPDIPANQQNLMQQKKQAIKHWIKATNERRKNSRLAELLLTWDKSDEQSDIEDIAIITLPSSNNQNESKDIEHNLTTNAFTIQKSDVCKDTLDCTATLIRGLYPNNRGPQFVKIEAEGAISLDDVIEAYTKVLKEDLIPFMADDPNNLFNHKYILNQLKLHHSGVYDKYKKERKKLAKDSNEKVRLKTLEQENPAQRRPQQSAGGSNTATTTPGRPPENQLVGIFKEQGTYTAQDVRTFVSNKQLDPQKTVFVFPGNSTHNHDTDNQNLEDYLAQRKSGAGLAQVAGALTQQNPAIKTLSLSTMESPPNLENLTLQLKVLTYCFGQGYHVLLPVRNQTSNGNQLSDIEICELSNKNINNSPKELSFLGGVATAPQDGQKNVVSLYHRVINAIAATLTQKKGCAPDEMETHLISALNTSTEVKQAFSACYPQLQDDEFENFVTAVASGYSSANQRSNSIRPGP